MTERTTELEKRLSDQLTGVVTLGFMEAKDDYAKLLAVYTDNNPNYDNHEAARALARKAFLGEIADAQSNFAADDKKSGFIDEVDWNTVFDYLVPDDLEEIAVRIKTFLLGDYS